MSVTSQTARSGPFVGASYPQAVASGFAFQQSSDLLVINVGQASAPHDPPLVMALGSDYTVSGGGYNSSNAMQAGTITLAAGGANSIQVGDIFWFLRNVPVNQIASAIASPLTGVLVEEAIDKQATISQQLTEQAGRSLRFEQGEILDGTLNLALRKNSLLGFDLNGVPTFVTGLPATTTNLASLKAIPTTLLLSGTLVNILGYYTANDGGGGLFYYSSTTAGADNGGTIITPNSAVGSWIRVYHDHLDPKWFGAYGDNSHDDRAAILTCDTLATSLGIPTWISGGSYKIGSSLTFASNVTFLGGGSQLFVGAGVTILFSARMTAGLYRIFQATGGGLITFNQAANIEGFPEWWGAATGTLDAAPFINACLAALPVTRLQAGDYFCSSTVQMNLDHRKLIGSGCQYPGVTNPVTRVAVNSATLDTILVGPVSQPGSINGFNADVIIEDVEFARTIAPAVTTTSASITAQWLIYAKFKRVKVAESMLGFHMKGLVNSQLDNCFAFRSAAGTGGTDFFKGFYVDGNTSIGANGGNASLYINYCTAALGGIVIANSDGLYADAAFTDLFIESFETTATARGINIQGNGNNTSLDLGNTDLQIKHPVLDQFTVAGILFNNLNKYGSAQVVGGYYGAASGSTAAIQITSSLAALSIIGGQAILSAASSCYGIKGNSSNFIQVEGFIALECAQSVVDLTTCNNCRIEPICKNFTFAITGAYVTLEGNCNRNYIQPFAMGGSGASPAGVVLVSTTNGNNEINCSGIDPAALAGASSANKLKINSVQITTTGLSGTNLVSGVMT